MLRNFSFTASRSKNGPHLFSDAEEAISLLSCLFTASLTCEAPTNQHARRLQPTAPATAATAAGRAVVTGAVFVRPPGTAAEPNTGERGDRARTERRHRRWCVCVRVPVKPRLGNSLARRRLLHLSSSPNRRYRLLSLFPTRL